MMDFAPLYIFLNNNYGKLTSMRAKQPQATPPLLPKLADAPGLVTELDSELKRAQFCKSILDRTDQVEL